MKLAWSLQVTRGGKLRVDSTVVPTNIHHPTDSGLLEEGVRVLSRLLPRAKGVLGEATPLGQGLFALAPGASAVWPSVSGKPKWR